MYIYTLAKNLHFLAGIRILDEIKLNYEEIRFYDNLQSQPGILAPFELPENVILVIYKRPWNQHQDLYADNRDIM